MKTVEKPIKLRLLILADQYESEEILPSSNQRVLHNRVHWAKFYMSKAGLIESSKRDALQKALTIATGRSVDALKPGSDLSESARGAW